jgi:hypothetical protein
VSDEIRSVHNVRGNTWVRTVDGTFRSFKKAAAHYGIDKGAIAYALKYTDGFVKKVNVTFHKVSGEK